MIYKLYSLDNEFIKESDSYPFKFTGIINYYGAKYWLKNGVRHRLDGPAIEHFNGCEEYWVEGEAFPEITTKESFKLYIDLLKLKGV